MYPLRRIRGVMYPQKVPASSEASITNDKRGGRAENQDDSKGKKKKTEDIKSMAPINHLVLL